MVAMLENTRGLRENGTERGGTGKGRKRGIYTSTRRYKENEVDVSGDRFVKKKWPSHEIFVVPFSSVKP